MTASITAAEVAVAIRAATDTEQVPDAAQMVLDFLVPASIAIVEDYAPHAPRAVQNAAVIRLTGWMYESDPAAARVDRGFTISGAANLLSRWREHRAGAVGNAAAAGGEVPPGPSGGGVPDAPAFGEFVLTAVNGALQWVAFPQPPR